MAVHFGLYPYDCIGNTCYLKIMDDYLQDNLTQWSQKELRDQFGKADLDKLLEYGFLIPQRNNMVCLAFTLPGTVLEIIIDHLRREIFSFTELLVKIPKHIKCSSQKLRNFLIYLINFNIVQAFPFPCSGITWVAIADCEEQVITDKIEKDLDYVYQLSDRLELRYVYPIDPFEGAEDLSNFIKSSRKP